jgi:hypothetical protein
MFGVLVFSGYWVIDIINQLLIQKYIPGDRWTRADLLHFTFSVITAAMGKLLKGIRKNTITTEPHPNASPVEKGKKTAANIFAL